MRTIILQLVVDLVGVGVMFLVIRNLLRLQHRLRGATRVFRWVVVIVGIGGFEAWLNRRFPTTLGYLPLGVLGLIVACFFFAFPDISFYLAEGYRRLRRGTSRSAEDSGQRK
jgi:hypothetical protein